MLCQLMDVAIGIAGVDYGNCLIEATEGGGAVAHVTIGESQYIVGQHMLAASFVPFLSAWRFFIQACSVFQFPMVRRSGSKLMPTFTIGSPERANLEA